MNKKIVLLTSLSCLLFAPAIQPQLFGMGYSSNTEQQALDVKNDAKINLDIQNALKNDKNFAGVKVNTLDGVVTLSGFVDSQKSKADIEAKAQAVPGVNKIINNLEVKNTQM